MVNTFQCFTSSWHPIGIEGHKSHICKFPMEKKRLNIAKSYS